MTWTSPAELRAQVQKLWDNGALLAQLAGGAALFPRRLTLKGPTSSELAERFDAVRIWIGALREGENYRVVMRELRHRILGSNLVPAEIWVDTLADALALIGKGREAQRFCALLAQTRARQGAALPWLAAHPLKALELAERWPLLLDVVAWFQAHPRPGIYLRQIDVPGVHSKFIEAHRALLSELLELALPAAAIDASATGASGFCRRYGLRDKPLRIRLRMLDPSLALLPGGAEQDITLDHASFARLAAPVERVFITENEINFLALPPVPASLVLFGAGYGFEMLAQAAWLQNCTILYWGDIDTHGFAILDQLRALFPHVESIMMDRATLFAHEAQWGHEAQPLLRDLARLSAAERALFDQLRDNRIRPGLRLEQERIGFGWVEAALRALASEPPVS